MIHVSLSVCLSVWLSVSVTVTTAKQVSISMAPVQGVRALQGPIQLHGAGRNTPASSLLSVKGFTWTTVSWAVSAGLIVFLCWAQLIWHTPRKMKTLWLVCGFRFSCVCVCVCVCFLFNLSYSELFESQYMFICLCIWHLYVLMLHLTPPPKGPALRHIH